MYKKPKIVFPLNGGVDNISKLLKYSDIDEFYIGIKNKNISLSHHYSPLGALDRSDIIKIANLAKENNKKINIPLNIYFFNSKLKEILEDELDFISSLKINHVVVGNLEIFKIIKEKYPKIKTSASSLFGIRSIEAAKFFYQLGFDRIIFPRSIDIKDAITIGNYFKGKKEIEMFIYGGGCTFCESTCHLPHVLLGKNDKDNLPQIIENYSPIPICNLPVFFNNKKSGKKLIKLTPGFKGCGICYLKILNNNGISHFKVTGRTLNIKKGNELLEKMNYVFSNDITPSICTLESTECLYNKEDVMP